MNKFFEFPSVLKVINIINSCKTIKQLDNCKKIINNYIELIKHNGVINSEKVKERLIEEFDKRKEVIINNVTNKKKYSKSKKEKLILQQI